MADSKISALTSLASGHATGDLLPIVDVSDTTQAASGTTKQTTLANLLANLPGPTDATGISYTGQSLTGSNASTLLNLAATWNTSGTPTAVKLNVTDTASNAASLLMDLQVGGTGKMSIRKDGSIWPGGYSSGIVGLIPHTNTDVILGVPSSNYFRISPYSSGWLLGGGTMVASSTGGYGWASVGGASNGGDTFLSRLSAGVVRLNDVNSKARALLGGGASVASATALPAPTGRVFHVTGTTTITSITSTNFEAGAVITMIFDASLTVTHGSNIILAGATNFAATANDTLTMSFDGTNWYEVCRSVN